MSESDSNSSIIAQSSRDLFTDVALQQRLRLETERIAQYELNQSSDAFFTAHYPHLIRYKRTLKNQRRKEGEKNSDGKYIFYHQILVKVIGSFEVLSFKNILDTTIVSTEVLR